MLYVHGYISKRYEVYNVSYLNLNERSLGTMWYNLNGIL